MSARRRRVPLKPHVKALVILAALLLFVQLAPCVLASAWVCTVGTLAAAKREGMYATPAEAMQARVRRSWIGVERVEIVRVGPNAFDGSKPHVWFVTAKVWADRRGDGKPIGYRGYDLAGSFFVQVKDGWVDVAEGRFPELLGTLMRFFDYWG